MSNTEFFVLLGLGLVMVALQAALLMRRGGHAGAGADTAALFDALEKTSERTERELRSQVQTSAQGTRQELSGLLAEFQRSIGAQVTGMASLQTGQIDAFAQQLAKLTEANAQQLEAMRNAISLQAKAGREEQAGALKRFGDTLNQTLATLTESNAQRMAEIRGTLEAKIRDLQSDNGARLEEMRRTVDEKLHATLEHRLGESFKLVSDRLDKVHQGLGEMQQLAIGVGDLKRVLTNVKTRGTWGEVQLGMLLEQMLTADQYAKNVETVPGSGERVEFAIRLPGLVDGGAPVWMPIDAKFPKEQYERMVDAVYRADADADAVAVALAVRHLEHAGRLPRAALTQCRPKGVAGAGNRVTGSSHPPCPSYGRRKQRGFPRPCRGFRILHGICDKSQAILMTQGQR